MSGQECFWECSFARGYGRYNDCVIFIVSKTKHSVIDRDLCSLRSSLQNLVC